MSSSNINTTNIFQFLASFAQILTILPQKYLYDLLQPGLCPILAMQIPFYRNIITGICSMGLQREKVKEIWILQIFSHFL